MPFPKITSSAQSFSHSSVTLSSPSPSPPQQQHLHGEGATVSFDSVAFSFLTYEEFCEHSFVRITSARFLDTLDKPVPGGLNDPAMGPLRGRAKSAREIESQVAA
ncbi:hypothetical protein OIU76_021306 [Salix suchowensis]|nr:hypothetical protein OIU76_021306 [Salix suchowensis]KAJ6316679.1 hypothetical protein OIU78_019878 [Salix suchowensis]